MKFSRRLGFILLAAWLILSGLIELLGLNFAGLQVIMGILAIAAGVLLLVYR